MLVRKLVSGVRNSWPASEMSWACCWRDAASAASMALNERARRASSSSPFTSMVDSRSWVVATCSAAAVSRSTGRMVAFPTMYPRTDGDADARESDDPQDEA